MATKKKAAKSVTRKGTRKCAIARATVAKGTGKVLVNGQGIQRITSPIVKSIVTEVLGMAEANSIDISVRVRGGGEIGQAQAIRTAIAKAAIDYHDNAEMKHEMAKHDRFVVISDSRQVEPKKCLGRKARARRTVSKR